MTTKRRKHIPMLAKLHAALYQLGFEPNEVDLDHDPALGLRPMNADGTDTVPAASDPKFLVWRPRAEHAVKTRGSGATTAGSDIGRIAKVKRIEADPDGGAEFRKRLLRSKAGPKPKSKWASRPFRGKGKRK